METKERIKTLLNSLNKGVYEKEEVMALSLLSAIAGESIFLLGAPGVAKSLIARQLKYAFFEGSKKGGHFEYLMNRFSTPDEIFGPVSISKLKDHDKYERVVDNYLPKATVVFLDEIWKAGPSIQNALLTVLNEKIYRNGEEEIKVPMKALISASNELPVKGEGLEALWDRFLIRYDVKGIAGEESFREMISRSPKVYDNVVEDNEKITGEEYSQWSEQIDSIEVSENIFHVIEVVRNYVDEYNKKDEQKENQIYISDRRWKKIVRLLRTSAFLNGRKAVDLMDCFLIAHCIWNEQGQQELMSLFVNDTLEKHSLTQLFNLSDVKAEIQTLKGEVQAKTTQYKEVRKKRLKEYDDQYYRFKQVFENRHSSNEEWYYLKVNDFKAWKKGDQFATEKVEVYKYKSHNYEKEWNLLSNYQNRNYSSERNYFIKNEKSLSLYSKDYYSPEVRFRFEFEQEDYIDREVSRKRPSDELISQWMELVSKIKDYLADLRKKVEDYKQNEIEDFRSNLFVKKEKLGLLESSINNTETQIGVVELDLLEIELNYLGKRRSLDVKLIEQSDEQPVQQV